MDNFWFTSAINAQEDASYYAWMARVDMEKGDIESALFFQEESAYFAELARNALGINDYS